MLDGFTKNRPATPIFKPSVTKNMVFQIETRRMRWAGHVARMGERRGFLVGKSLENKPLERPRCKWKVILRYIFRK
jgi:hypothetical protein